ncbi:hypothetical protein fugu_018761, partial [Takifugu bimaculatus]
MGSNGCGAKRREERRKREGRGCLPGSHRNSRDSHIGWKGSMSRGRRTERRAFLSGSESSAAAFRGELLLIGGDGRAYEEMAGNLASSWLDVRISGRSNRVR